MVTQSWHGKQRVHILCRWSKYTIWPRPSKKLKLSTCISIVHLVYFVTKLRFKAIFSCTTFVLNFVIFMIYFNLCHKVHIYIWMSYMYVPSFKIVWSFEVRILWCICPVCNMSCIWQDMCPLGETKRWMIEMCDKFHCKNRLVLIFLFFLRRGSSSGFMYTSNWHVKHQLSKS